MACTVLVHLEAKVFRGEVLLYSRGESEKQQQQSTNNNCQLLGGGFKHFLFSPLFGEDSHFD